MYCMYIYIFLSWGNSLHMYTCLIMSSDVSKTDVQIACINERLHQFTSVLPILQRVCKGSDEFRFWMLRQQHCTNDKQSEPTATSPAPISSSIATRRCDKMCQACLWSLNPYLCLSHISLVEWAFWFHHLKVLQYFSMLEVLVKVSEAVRSWSAQGGFCSMALALSPPSPSCLAVPWPGLTA